MLRSSDPLAEQLEQILSVVRGGLGPDVIGAYLYGSAVAGGLRPRSDLDVFVVSRRRTTREEKQRLVDGLVPLSRRGSGPPSWRPVELTVVAQPDVRPWRYPPRMDFQYGEWLRDELGSGNLEPSPESNFDLAVLVTMVLLRAKPLLGPPAAEVLDPVPRDDLVRAMVHGVDALLADLGPDTANVVLTLARIWTTIATGEVRSKEGAADWALSRLPADHRPVLQRARAVYLGSDEDRWDDLESRVRPHADHVLREIRRLAGGASA
jgi:predicted nucleotidyltransferase